MSKPLIKYLCIVQARLGSTRFPNKVMQVVGGVPIVKRVWLAAKMSKVDKVVVAWPERYLDLDENDVLNRFRRISSEFPSKFIVRLTADCPLITSVDINKALNSFIESTCYYSNHNDGRDVQVFCRHFLFDNDVTDKEHIIADFTTPNTGLSVNTKEDLERVRAICAIK